MNVTAAFRIWPMYRERCRKGVPGAMTKLRIAAEEFNGKATSQVPSSRKKSCDKQPKRRARWYSPSRARLRALCVIVNCKWKGGPLSRPADQFGCHTLSEASRTVPTARRWASYDQFWEASENQRHS